MTTPPDALDLEYLRRLLKQAETAPSAYDSLNYHARNALEPMLDVIQAAGLDAGAHWHADPRDQVECDLCCALERAGLLKEDERE